MAKKKRESFLGIVFRKAKGKEKPAGLKASRRNVVKNAFDRITAAANVDAPRKTVIRRKKKK